MGQGFVTFVARAAAQRLISLLLSPLSVSLGLSSLYRYLSPSLRHQIAASATIVAISLLHSISLLRHPIALSPSLSLLRHQSSAKAAGATTPPPRCHYSSSHVEIPAKVDLVFLSEVESGSSRIPERITSLTGNELTRHLRERQKAFEEKSTEFYGTKINSMVLLNVINNLWHRVNRTFKLMNFAEIARRRHNKTKGVQQAIVFGKQNKKLEKFGLKN
ncbi:uncharacterized protein LOC144557991 [Carex rostrata]